MLLLLNQFPHFYCLNKEGRLLCEFVYYVDHVKKSNLDNREIQENMNILISFVERGLVFTKYYHFPTTVLSFFYSYFTKNKVKMTLFQYLLFHHPSDKFIEYLLSNPLFSCNPSSPILVHDCPFPKSLLLVYLETNMKNISYSMFTKKEPHIISRLQSFLSHVNFQQQSSPFLLHYFALMFVLEHEFGSEKLLKPFLESGIFKHLSFFPPLKKFKTNMSNMSNMSMMSILLVSKKKKKNEKRRMCRLLLQYGGHFEIRTLENTIENYREEVENSFDFFSQEKQEDYWEEIYDCLAILREENERFETFIEFYFPSALCPLTLNVLYQPLLLPDGLSYEKKDFEKWKTICQENNNRSSIIISPATNKPLKHEKIEMNQRLLDLITHIRWMYSTLYLFPSYEEKIQKLFSKDYHLQPSSCSLCSLCSLCSNYYEKKNNNNYNNYNNNNNFNNNNNYNNDSSNIVFKNVWEEYLQFKNHNGF